MPGKVPGLTVVVDADVRPFAKKLKKARKQVRKLTRDLERCLAAADSLGRKGETNAEIACYIDLMGFGSTHGTSEESPS